MNTLKNILFSALFIAFVQAAPRQWTIAPATLFKVPSPMNLMLSPEFATVKAPTPKTHLLGPIPEIYEIQISEPKPDPDAPSPTQLLGPASEPEDHEIQILEPKPDQEDSNKPNFKPWFKPFFLPKPVKNQIQSSEPKQDQEDSNKPNFKPWFKPFFLPKPVKNQIQSSEPKQDQEDSKRPRLTSQADLRKFLKKVE